jgi:hypothetical protein
MKKYFFITFFVFNFSLYSQERKANELDTIRQQGYLIIGTNELGKLSDIAPKFLFIPLKKTEKNIELSYVKNSQSNYNNLYIPTPYLYNENELGDLNFYIKKITKEKDKIKLNQELVPIMDMLNKCDNLYRFKQNLEQPIKTFKIVYLDGIWVKLKVPKKSASLFLEEYNKVRLNKNEKNYYEYYFLIETKAISYDVLLTDKSIEIVNK